ncbi:hypothetical protein [Poriferisphaera sp. WC338]|uniref:hypothetical protein n=1 Tax=Poriferisphaera sp. WC338 TaxID=3425129 RepID=UPI003D813C91
MSNDLRLTSVSPLVRYVDKDRAILDVKFTVAPMIPSAANATNRTVEILIDVDGSDGFHDEGKSHVKLQDGVGLVRFELIQPQRWWPANMGEQPLYELTLGLLVDQIITDSASIMFGLSSVREDQFTQMSLDPTLLVNGEVCDIESVVVVDQLDEQQLLPANGGSLLIVRDHFGPDVLYEAADRAGILLIQCIPVNPTEDDTIILDNIQRITPHPSLAGWFIGHLGDITQQIESQIRNIDPTHTIFHEFPLEIAA